MSERLRDFGSIFFDSEYRTYSLGPMFPFSKTLEPLVLPDAERLKREAAALVRGQQ